MAFVSSPIPPALSIYDERCAITLTRNLDVQFDMYELGRRQMAQNEVQIWSEVYLFLSSTGKSSIHELIIRTNCTHFA